MGTATVKDDARITYADDLAALVEEGSRERGVARLPALIAEPANSPGRT